MIIKSNILCFYILISPPTFGRSSLCIQFQCPKRHIKDLKANVDVDKTPVMPERAELQRSSDWSSLGSGWAGLKGWNAPRCGEQSPGASLHVWPRSSDTGQDSNSLSHHSVEPNVSVGQRLAAGSPKWRRTTCCATTSVLMGISRLMWCFFQAAFARLSSADI